MRTIALLSLLALVACADEDPGRLKVRGTATVTVAGATTGFDFPTDTLLEDDRVARTPGRMAGHCTIGLGAVGEPDVLSVALSRPDAAPPGAGITSFAVRSEGALGATVTASLGTQQFAGATGGASCTVDELYVRAQDGLVGIAVACGLADGSGQPAQATAELHFAGCVAR